MVVLCCVIKMMEFDAKIFNNMALIKCQPTVHPSFPLLPANDCFDGLVMELSSITSSTIFDVGFPPRRSVSLLCLFLIHSPRQLWLVGEPSYLVAFSISYRTRVHQTGP